MASCGSRGSRMLRAPMASRFAANCSRSRLAELPALAQAVREARMDVVYSSPDGLWRTDGALDHSAIGRALEAAAALGAPRLKMSLGSFHAASRAGVGELKERMARSKIELLIENDQTAAAGTLAAIQRFLAQAGRAGSATRNDLRHGQLALDG